MSRRGYGQACSIARALDVVGERWTFLIIRDAFVGHCRFDSFLDSLGLARNVLTERLNSLVDHGILERVPYQHRPLRHEYHLTPMGRQLAPVLVALMHWGDRHLTDDEPPRIAEHDGCGGTAEVTMVCTRCGRTAAPGEVVPRLSAPHSH